MINMLRCVGIPWSHIYSTRKLLNTHWPQNGTFAFPIKKRKYRYICKWNFYLGLNHYALYICTLINNKWSFLSSHRLNLWETSFGTCTQHVRGGFSRVWIKSTKVFFFFFKSSKIFDKSVKVSTPFPLLLHDSGQKMIKMAKMILILRNKLFLLLFRV